jgi:hypothetical protein
MIENEIHSNKRLRDSDNGVKCTKKILSTVGEVKYSNESETNTSLNETASNLRPELQNPPDIIMRNKRLFGALMGHLGSAKKLLEKDSSKIEQQIHTKLIVTEKNEQANQMLLELHRKIKHNEEEKVSYISQYFSSCYS